MPSARYCFGRNARLLQPADFQLALGCRPAARGQLFVFHHKPVVASGTQAARLGLIIPKRLIRSAVRRNTIKRVIRECFRLRQSTCRPGLLVVRLKAPIARCTLTQLRQLVRLEINQLLDRLT